MCGRARCTLRREQVAAAAGVATEEFVDGDKYSPVENLGPGRYIPVVTGGRGDGGAIDASDRNVGHGPAKVTLQAMQWGLVPSFTKPTAKPDHFIMFNARSENLQERPAFKRLVQSKRCVVICDGYYEWQQVDKREKQPFYFFREGTVMKFAGLYDTWRNEDGDEMHSCTIVTTAVSAELKWIHTRMPESLRFMLVILTEDGAERWLSDAPFRQLQDLLQSYHGEDLKHHPVDKRIGSTKFQSEECSKKVNIKLAGDIKSFFGVKHEKQEAAASPTTSAWTHDDQDKKLKDELTPTKSDAASTESFSALHGMSSPPKTGFVPASTLLGSKRAASSPAKSPAKSQLKSPKRPKTSAAKSPVKGTLLAFFKPKDPK